MIETACQPGILASPPSYGRSLTFRHAPGVAPREPLRKLRSVFAADWGVVGLGEPLVQCLHCTVPGLRVFPALAGPACVVPSTQGAAWVLLHGPDRTTIFDRSEQVIAALGGGFAVDDAMDTFLYADSRDLTGYVDGTENPKGDARIAIALVPESPDPASHDLANRGVAGSSFVAVQRWAHDLQRFRRNTPAERDAIIGRRRDNDEEIADAPESAHVKRTAQEGYDPPTFMLRQSMSWATAESQGLEFIAYAATLDAFERQMRHMLGLDDGTVDALFTFSRPLTGGYYWCPPIAANRLDLGYLRL
jgi:putative iron-dependent peroxidase